MRDTNLLLCGDNIEIMNKLLNKGYRDKITLIYIDPPFYSQNNYDTFGDKWKSLDEYLEYMKPRIELMRELLSDNGSFYLHCDWHASHYLKVMCDEIFGYDNFRNEIIWSYKVAGVSRRYFARKHDNFFWYVKNNEKYIYNEEKEKSYHEKLYNYGEHYKEYFDKEKNAYYSLVAPRDVWDDIHPLKGCNNEITGFVTQKPEKLLSKIIKASSNERDIIADFFCGSGTTLAVAEKLDRRWIGCDVSSEAIEITKKRLEDVGGLFSNFQYIREGIS